MKKITVELDEEMVVILAAMVAEPPEGLSLDGADAFLRVQTTVHQAAFDLGLTRDV